MRLRGPLARWEASLVGFSPTFRGAVGPWLGPLRLALGPIVSRTRPGAGEPDGYDGHTRRGAPERLLMSEWLLADEVPDEFLRRAAEGELGYLKLARIEPAGARRCLALFDVGPEVLGAPRLALLALLLAFARRAEEAGAVLIAGALQRSEVLRGHQLDKGKVERLLLAGAAEVGGADMLAGWRERLPLADGDELWVVGSRGTADRLAPGGVLRGAGELAGVVSVVDTLALEAGLEVAIRRPGRPRRAVQLALPPAEDCLAALRDPFAAPGASIRRAPTDRVNALIASPSGRRLALMSPSGVLSRVQLSGKPGRASVRAVATEPSAVAVGWWRSSVVRLKCSDQRLSLAGSPYRPDGQGEVLWEPPLVLQSDGSYLPMLAHRAWFRGGYELDLWLLDRARQLLKIQPHHDRPNQVPIHLIAEEVYGLARTGLGATFVGRVAPESSLTTGGIQVWIDGATPWLIAEPGGPAVPDIFFGCSDRRTGDGLLLAVEREDRWLVRCAGREVTLEPGDGRVVGVAMDGCWPDPGPALAVLEGGELSLRGLRGRRVIARDVAPSPAAVFATLEPWAAWINREGRLVVYQLEQNRVWAEVGL